MNLSQRLRTIYQTWGWLLILLVLLGYAVALRLINYTGVLDWDVIEYTDQVRSILNGDFEVVFTLRSSDFRLGLILPLSLLYAVFGPSEAVTVVYPLFASLLGILAIYGIGRLLANERAGLIAALFWASLPLGVFLSTLFGPDGILASFVNVAVYFLLLASRFRSTRMWIAYALAGLFVLVAIFVKPSAVIILPFFVIFFVYRTAKENQQLLHGWLVKVRSWQWTHRALPLVALSGFLLLIGYFQAQRSPFLMQLYRTATDLSSLLILGNTQETLPGALFLSSLVFAVFSPIFVIAWSGQLVKLKADLIPAFLWGASVFFYFEWGTRSTNPAVYAPFFMSLNDRNLLFVLAPFVVLAGIFFGQRQKRRETYLLVILASLVVIPMAWFQRETEYAGAPLALTSLAFMLAILGSLAAPLLAMGSGRFRSFLRIAFPLVILVAFLYPTPPSHISEPYWQSQVKYRAAVSQAADFFLEHPDYPILSLDPRNARELNFASKFLLGVSKGDLGDERIIVVSDPLAWDESAYVYFRDEVNQYLPVPSDWWKVAQIDTGLPRPLVIYRVLSDVDAQRELLAAQSAMDKDASLINLERLLAAGVNASDLNATLLAGQALAQVDAQAYPASLFAPVIVEAYQQRTLPAHENLLQGVTDFQSSSANSNNQTTLAIDTDTEILQVEKNEDGPLQIYTPLSLEPNSVYLFVVDIRSSVGVDLIAQDKTILTDSQDYSAIHGEWEEQVVVFVTDDWSGGSVRDFHIFSAQKSGIIELKNFRLFRLDYGSQ